MLACSCMLTLIVSLNTLLVAVSFVAMGAAFLGTHRRSASIEALLNTPHVCRVCWQATLLPLLRRSTLIQWITGTCVAGFCFALPASWCADS